MNWNLAFAIELALKSSLILTAAFGMSALLRRASAAVRHLVWVMATLVILALPLPLQIAPVWVAPATVPPAAASHVETVTTLPDAPVTPASPINIQWTWAVGAFLVA